MASSAIPGDSASGPPSSCYYHSGAVIYGTGTPEYNVLIYYILCIIIIIIITVYDISWGSLAPHYSLPLLLPL